MYTERGSFCIRKISLLSGATTGIMGIFIFFYHFIHFISLRYIEWNTKQNDKRCLFDFRLYDFLELFMIFLFKNTLSFASLKNKLECTSSSVIIWYPICSLMDALFFFGRVCFKHLLLLDERVFLNHNISGSFQICV